MGIYFGCRLCSLCVVVVFLENIWLNMLNEKCDRIYNPQQWPKLLEEPVMENRSQRSDVSLHHIRITLVASSNPLFCNSRSFQHYVLTRLFEGHGVFGVFYLKSFWSQIEVLELGEPDLYPDSEAQSGKQSCSSDADATG